MTIQIWRFSNMTRTSHNVSRTWQMLIRRQATEKSGAYVVTMRVQLKWRPHATPILILPIGYMRVSFTKFVEILAVICTRVVLFSNTELLLFFSFK